MNHKPSLLLSFILLLVISANTLCAQSLMWAKHIQSYSSIASIHPDLTGNRIMAVGKNQATCICKYDADSTIIWERAIYGVNGIVELDYEGNIYLAGYANKSPNWTSVDFDPGPGFDGIMIGQGFFFIAKYDSAGSLKWVKSMPKTSVYSYVYNFSVDSLKNMYISGQYTGTLHLDPDFNSVNLTSTTYTGFVAKYDSTGKIIMAKDGPTLTWAKADIAGNIYGFVDFKDSLDIQPGTGVVKAYGVEKINTCVVKYDKQCNVLWNKIYGTQVRLKGQELDVDFYGNVYMCGNFDGSADFEPGPGITILGPNSGSSRGVYVVKFGVNGSFIWAKGLLRIGISEPIFSCKVNKITSEIYLFGMIETHISDFDPDTPVVNRIPESNSIDHYVAKYNKDGKFQWILHTPGGGFSDLLEVGTALYCVGATGDSVDVNPTLTGRYVLYPPAFNQAHSYIVKYNIPLSVQEINQNKLNVQVYPNPLSATEVTIDLGQKYNQINIALLDITGKTISSGKRTGTAKFTYDTGNLTSGMYLLHVQTSEGNATVKLIKN